MADLWFVMWKCGCTDVQPSRDALPDLCPGHAAFRTDVDRITLGAEGHICSEAAVCPEVGP